MDYTELVVREAMYVGYKIIKNSFFDDKPLQTIDQVVEKIQNTLSCNLDNAQKIFELMKRKYSEELTYINWP